MRKAAKGSSSSDDCLVGCTVILLLMTLGCGVGLLVLFSIPKFTHSAFPFPVPQALVRPQHGQVDWTKITSLGMAKCGKTGEFCHDIERESEGWKALLHATPMGAVLDVGSGRGGLTILALSMSRRVVTAEPLLKNINNLQTEILTIRKASGSSLYHVLATNKDDDSKMLKETANSFEIVAKPSIQEILGKEVVRVPTITIDSLSQHAKIDRNIAVVRLNLAGFDGVAVRGMTSLFDLARVKFLVVDVNTKTLLAKSDFSLTELLNHLHKNNFEIFLACDGNIDSLTRREMPVVCHRFYQLCGLLAGGFGTIPPNTLLHPKHFESINSLLVKNQKGVCCIVRVVARRKESGWKAALWWQ